MITQVFKVDGKIYCTDLFTQPYFVNIVRVEKDYVFGGAVVYIDPVNLRRAH